MSKVELKIVRQYKGETKEIEISVKKFIELTEGRGYYKPNTALDVLKEIKSIQTHWAWYTLK